METTVKKINVDAALTSKNVRSFICEFKNFGNSAEFEQAMKSLCERDLATRLSWVTQMTDCVTLLDKKADILVLSFLVSFSFFLGCPIKCRILYLQFLVFMMSDSLILKIQMSFWKDTRYNVCQTGCPARRIHSL